MVGTDGDIGGRKPIQNVIVTDGGGQGVTNVNALENRCTARYRGLESLPLRQLFQKVSVFAISTRTQNSGFLQTFCKHEYGYGR